MSKLPVDYARLSKDILELVRETSLTLLTSKYVRTHMEKKHNVELKEHRKQIDEIIRDSIEKIESDKLKAPEATPINGVAKNSSSTSKSQPESSPSPPPLSNPTADLSLDDDNDIYSAIKRRRAQRSTAVQRKPAAKRARKTKEAGTKKNTAFTRICVLSDELSSILDRKYMRRSDVVKAMWVYFKEHNMLDPKDKRFVLIDDRMRTVFGSKRVQAFGMMKTLKNHIKDLDFLDEDTRRTALREIEELEANGELDLGKTSTPGPSTKALVEDSVSSDSSSSSDEEPPAKKKPVTVKSAPPSKSVNNKVFNESPPSTSKPEEPRAAKLVLRISKKNDRVVSVKVNDEDESNQGQNANSRVNPTNDNGVGQSLSSNTSTADFDGPPQLDLEVPNDAASTSQESSSDSSSNSSSGSSSSSSAASSPEHNGSTNNINRKNLSNDLQLSESGSDT